MGSGLKLGKSCFLGFFLLVLAGCGATFKPFMPMDPAHTPKPARLAVVCAGKSDLDKNLAQALSEELRSRTTFQVVSQEEIGKRINNYPLALEVVEPADPAKPVWVSAAEKKKLDALHSQLQVDYLFVLWGRNLTRYVTQGSTDYYMTVLGNLLEYPRGEVIALTQFSPSRTVHLWEIFKKESFFINDMIMDSAEEITDEFLVVTKAEKIQKAR